ncbi:MAG: hypothetical protein J6L85_02235 [Clostridia bacterium]|nr:hypothetical protein [Clostridia bacterium]
MKFTKKIRDDRNGLAIELAMMVMVVTFALSILLTTVALLQVDHSNSNTQDVKRRYELEQIGEKYLAALKNGELSNLPEDQGDYKIVTKTTENLVVCSKADNEIALTIELQDGKITKWELN